MLWCGPDTHLCTKRPTVEFFARTHQIHSRGPKTHVWGFSEVWTFRNKRTQSILDDSKLIFRGFHRFTFWMGVWPLEDEFLGIFHISIPTEYARSGVKYQILSMMRQYSLELTACPFSFLSRRKLHFFCSCQTLHPGWWITFSIRDHRGGKPGSQAPPLNVPLDYWYLHICSAPKKFKVAKVRLFPGPSFVGCCLF